MPKPQRKVSHFRRIISRDPSIVSAISIGDIVSFNYRGEDIYDKTPMVFVLGKIGKYLEGVNLNYMTNYKVQQLLQESNYKKMKWYELYKDHFRTYFKSNIKSIKKIQYRKEVIFTKPNLEFEWKEAERYPEFKSMGKSGFIDYALKNGYVTKFSKIQKVLGNVNLNFNQLEKPKRKRFEAALSRGILEMSIAVKFEENDYDLVAGNTRISGAHANRVDNDIWVIDLKQYYEENE